MENMVVVVLEHIKLELLLYLDHHQQLFKLAAEVQEHQDIMAEKIMELHLSLVLQ